MSSPHLRRPHQPATNVFAFPFGTSLSYRDHASSPIPQVRLSHASSASPLTSSPDALGSNSSIEQLRWLGESPRLNYAPKIASPSPLRSPPHMIAPLATEPQQTVTIQTPQTVTSPTDVLYYHHRPSITSATSVDSTPTASPSPSRPGVHIARRHSGCLARPRLLHLPLSLTVPHTTGPTDTVAEVVAPGPAGAMEPTSMEILPFSPVSPNPMQGWSTRRGVAAGEVQSTGAKVETEGEPDSPALVTPFTPKVDTFPTDKADKTHNDIAFNSDPAFDEDEGIIEIVLKTAAAARRARKQSPAS